MNTYKVYTKEKCLVETNDYNDVHSLTWHRKDGPAAIQYYINGKTEKELYYVNDNRHRLDGPAIIVYDMNGNIIRTEYWIKDIEYTKEQYDKELLKLKVQLL